MKAPNAAARAHALVERALEELDMGDDDNAVIACHLQFAFDLLDEKVREIIVEVIDKTVVGSPGEDLSCERLLVTASPDHRTH